jgi:hypothetical protein
VQHEALVELAADVLDLLLVVGRAERARDERLCLAAGEDHRAVRAGEGAGLGPDRPDLVELAAVEPHAPLQDLVAQHLLLEILENAAWLRACRSASASGIEAISSSSTWSTVVVALELAANPHGFAERHVDLLLDLAVELVPISFFGR